MNLWQRDYQLTVGIGGRAVTIAPPFRIVFSADKSIQISLNKLTVKIWNLTPSHRQALVKDEWNVREYIPLALSIGYQGRLSLLFRGSVRKGETSREGADFVSTLECLDGGVDVLTGFTSTVARSKDQAINACLADMPNTGRGSVTEHPALLRPKVLVGNSARLISDLVEEDENFFIDNEQLFVLRDGEVRSSFVPLVTAKTGLFNTPTMSRGKITFDCILNPGLLVAGLCKLESRYAPALNGVYRIDQINYAGDYSGQDWRQTVTARLAQNYKVVL